jgi:hypothetical protein
LLNSESKARSKWWCTVRKPFTTSEPGLEIR